MTKDLTRRTFFAHGAGLAAGAASAQPGPRPSGKQVKIGVVGGRFGATFQWHLHPGSKVTAVCDLAPDRLQTMSEVYRCPNTFPRFQDLLRHPELDAVAVFTPAPLHAWMAVEAMNAGKHVISAVPAGMSLEELEKLLECVKRTGMKYMMAETTYYRPQIITCRQWSKEGKFGAISYSESEYHHNTMQLMFDDRGLPTWRHGLPPMLYITHQTGAIIPVTGERLTEVQAVGWGDKHEVLQTNRYQNPFWNTAAFFKTSGGHSSRIFISWHAPLGFAQRSQFYGEFLSYSMGRGPEGHTDTVTQLKAASGAAAGRKSEDEITVKRFEDRESDHWGNLPDSLKKASGHGGSHAHLTHEFTSSILEDRRPAVDIFESVAYTAPGIVAHQSALRGGEPLKIKDYGKAPA